MGDEASRRQLYERLRALAARPGAAGRYRGGERAGSSPPFPDATGRPVPRLVGQLPVDRPVRKVLGISAFYHDSAAALVVDGVPVAAAQEERFTRRKHDAGLPVKAVEYCLSEAGLRIHDVDLLTFYEEPWLKLDRLFQTAMAGGGRFEDLERVGWFEAVARNLTLPARLGPSLGYEGSVAFVPHHVSHAASAFYVSPFDQAACLVCDGVGEWATTTQARCDADGIEILEQVDYPHSLGLLYSTVTAHLGFAANSDEYKVMALASFGSPSFDDAMERALGSSPVGQFDLAWDPLTAAAQTRWPTESLEPLLGVARRVPGSRLDPEHFDLACSLQHRTDDVVAALLSRLRERTGLEDLVMAGGVALNGVANYRAFQRSGFRNLFIQPAAGDAGGALGAALFCHDRLGRPVARDGAKVFDPLLGPSFDSREVERTLREAGAPYRKVPRENVVALTAEALAEGKIVGWFQGRMEFGPRALGARSILADPSAAEMQGVLNSKIKRREEFRPFAPIILEERVSEILDVPRIYEPLLYMLMIVPIRDGGRERIPASVHVDGTARPQVVRRDLSPRLHELLVAFERESGVPALLNTSFNLAGEPIVCSPDDAYRTFRYSGMDLLVMEDCVATA